MQRKKYNKNDIDEANKLTYRASNLTIKEEPNRGWVVFLIILVVFLVAKCNQTINKQKINVEINEFLDIVYIDQASNQLQLSNLTLLRDVCACKNCYSCTTKFVIKLS